MVRYVTECFTGMRISRGHYVLNLPGGLDTIRQSVLCCSQGYGWEWRLRGR